jgi:cytochrome b561
MRVLVSITLLAWFIQPTIGMADSINLAAGASGETQRIEGHLDSLAALVILASAMIVAGLLNTKAAGARALGTAMAAVLCAAVAGWFFLFVMTTGILENPKPNQTPLDSAKPALLLGQALIAAVAAAWLALVAYHQQRDSKVLLLGRENEADRYGQVSRFLHWTIAILFIALIPMGIFASIIPEGTSFRNAYYVVHKTIGVVVIGLVFVRLVWNRLSPRPALDAALKPTERKLAKFAHGALYVAMVAVPITGFVMTSFHGYPTFFFAWEFGPFWGSSDSATIAWGSFHKYLLPTLVYLILGAHIAGALKHRFMDGHKQAFRRIVG